MNRFKSTIFFLNTEKLGVLLKKTDLGSNKRWKTIQSVDGTVSNCKQKIEKKHAKHHLDNINRLNAELAEKTVCVFQMFLNVLSCCYCWMFHIFNPFMYKNTSQKAVTLNLVTKKQNMAKVKNLLNIILCISYTDSRTCTAYVKDV